MISIVILAAGSAQRAEGPKMIWPVGGIPAIRRIAETALKSQAGELVVVTGAWAPETQAALEGLNLKLVHNQGYAAGQSSSLITGLKAIEPKAKAVIFMVSDQPYISYSIINKLIEIYRASQASIVAPCCQGKRFNPVLFDLPRWKARLMALTGDSGGRSILAENPSEICLVPFDDQPEAFMDFDTWAEYQDLMRDDGK